MRIAYPILYLIPIAIMGLMLLGVVPQVPTRVRMGVRIFGWVCIIGAGALYLVGR
jgi:hypothetical protein